MRLLLDTCAFLWLADDDPALSLAARAAATAPGNDVFVSSVSAAEVAVKFARGRLQLTLPPDQFFPSARRRSALAELPLDETAALGVARLPDLHRDPFDRLLIAQALAHGPVLVTPDEAIRRYPVPTLW